MADNGYEILKVELAQIKETVNEIKAKLDSCYVTNDQFQPVARIAYGIVALMGVALLGAIMKMVLK